jgi:hypothetical protein
VSPTAFRHQYKALPLARTPTTRSILLDVVVSSSLIFRAVRILLDDGTTRQLLTFCFDCPLCTARLLLAGAYRMSTVVAKPSPLTTNPLLVGYLSALAANPLRTK